MSTVNGEVFRKATAQDDRRLEEEAKSLLVESEDLAYSTLAYILPGRN